MLVAVVNAKNYLQAKQQLALAEKADAVELRLDYWESLDIEILRKLRKEIDLVTLFTLRTRSQGGYFDGSEVERLQIIQKLCELSPDYFDLEFDISDDFLKKIKTSFPRIKLISSYHNFLETPGDLNQLIKTMEKPEFDNYKIAVKANSTLDSLKLLEFLKENSTYKSLTVIGMGEYGECTRILGPIYGNSFNFSSLRNEFSTAPGQLTLETLIDIYNFRHLDQKTQVFALIGEIENSSFRPLLYNLIFNRVKRNAVCVTLPSNEHELAGILEICARLSWIGLMVANERMGINTEGTAIEVQIQQVLLNYKSLFGASDIEDDEIQKSLLHFVQRIKHHSGKKS